MGIDLSLWRISPPVELSQLDQSEFEGPCLMREERRANSIGYFWDDIGVSEFECWDCIHISNGMLNI